MAASRAPGYLRGISIKPTDPFLERCRQDRADYARYLEACESGQFHIGDGRPGNGITDRTPAHADHLRRIIAD
jgi:hypothetical protein